MKRITSNVGNGQYSNLEDVVLIKRLLSRVGLYKGNIEMPYIDAEMDNGIREFQKIRGLKQDGLIKPNGYTENELLKTTVKSQQYKCKNCGGFHGGVNGEFCPSCTVKL